MRYTGQILRKKNGVILHREAATFPSNAQVWMHDPEAKLDKPGGMEAARAPNPPLKE
jgi:hypothetical protein